MNGFYKRILEAIDARTLRERILLLGVSAAVIVLLAEALFVSPAQDRLRSDKLQIETARSEIATLSATISTLERQLAIDPNEDSRERIDALGARVTAERDRLASAVARFIDPVQMNHVLRALVTEHSGLELIALRSVSPTLLMANENNEQTTRDDTLQVWQRPVEIELSGAYAAMLAYLQALESLPWELRWDQLTVAVEADAPLHFTLRLHTLSLTSEWIGG